MPGLGRKLIEDQKIRAIAEEPHRRREQKLLNPVRLHSGAVENRFAQDGFPIGFDDIPRLFFMNIQNPGVSQIVAAVPPGVFPGGNAQCPGIHGAGGGGVQGGGNIAAEHRLHFPGFLPGDQPQIRHAVFQAVGQLFLQHPFRPGAGADHQTATAVKGNLQFRTQLLKLPVSPDGHPGLQAAHPVVIACVDNGGVGPSDTGAHILRLLDQYGGSLPAHQIPGREAA